MNKIAHTLGVIAIVAFMVYLLMWALLVTCLNNPQYSVQDCSNNTASQFILYTVHAI